MLEEPEPKAVPDDDVETPLAADVVPDEDNVLLVCKRTGEADITIEVLR